MLRVCRAAPIAGNQGLFASAVSCYNFGADIVELGDICLVSQITLFGADRIFYLRADIVFH